MKNDYKIEGDTTIIYLKKRTGEIFETLIDTEDLERIQKIDITWHVRWDKTTKSYYASACQYLGIFNEKPKYKTLTLHRIIMNANKGDAVDHIQHNTLDNRKEKLKLTTQDVNMINRKGANKNTSTGVRNVCWVKKERRYIVQLQVDGKSTCFGRFTDLEEAKKCAEKYRKEIYDKKYESA